MFQSSNKFCIYKKFFNGGDNKVWDHYHVKGKHRDSTHWSCDTNLRLYDSHLIIRKISKFDVKLNVIPNGLKVTWLFYWQHAIYQIWSRCIG